MRTNSDYKEQNIILKSTKKKTKEISILKEVL